MWRGGEGREGGREIARVICADCGTVTRQAVCTTVAHKLHRGATGDARTRSIRKREQERVKHRDVDYSTSFSYESNRRARYETWCDVSRRWLSLCLPLCTKF